VVHLANLAYFSGDLIVAHKSIVKILLAFKHLNNKKAIGVASNNMGNIMLAMYRTMVKCGYTTIGGMTKQQIISEGTAYFLQAIKLGEETYDEFYEKEGWSKNCLAFMQHLSNRYFNRAMFLLTVGEDHETPDLAKEMAFRDLDIAFNMDIEVVDQCVEMGILQSKKERFESIIGRVSGLLELLKLSYTNEWNLEELLDDALTLVKSVANNTSNDLCLALNYAGRMQQLDCHLISYIILTGGSSADAAKIAIRMLVEDEYIISNAYITAIGAMIKYTESISSEDLQFDKAAVKSELFSMRSSVKKEFDEQSHHLQQKSLKKMMSLSFIAVGDDAIDEELSNVSTYECNRGDVTMENF